MVLKIRSPDLSELQMVVLCTCESEMEQEGEYSK